MMKLLAEKSLFRGQINHKKRKRNIMGDRSPKANQKKIDQKKSRNDAIAAQKKAAMASKQAAGTNTK